MGQCRDAYPSIFLLVQGFDKCQLRGAILKGRKAGAGQRQAVLTKMWCGMQKTVKGKGANTVHLSILPSVCVTEGPGDRRKRAGNTDVASGRDKYPSRTPVGETVHNHLPLQQESNCPVEQSGYRLDCMNPN